VPASAAGRRVAWIETRFPARRRVIELVTALVRRTGRWRVIRREVLVRDRARAIPATDVVTTGRGERAWLVPRRGAGSRVMLELPGAPPRELAAGPFDALALEDGFTLRWSSFGAGFRFYDLPRPGTPACPRRRSGRRRTRICPSSPSTTSPYGPPSKSCRCH